VVDRLIWSEEKLNNVKCLPASRASATGKRDLFSDQTLGAARIHRLVAGRNASKEKWARSDSERINSGVGWRERLSVEEVDKSLRYEHIPSHHDAIIFSDW
jgi:hypothetical protein